MAIFYQNKISTMNAISSELTLDKLLEITIIMSTDRQAAITTIHCKILFSNPAKDTDDVDEEVYTLTFKQYS